jgi:hypothetical protein
MWLVETHGLPEETPVFVLASVLATTGSIAVSFPIDVAKTIMINQGVRGVAVCVAAAPLPLLPCALSSWSAAAALNGPAVGAASAANVSFAAVSSAAASHLAFAPTTAAEARHAAVLYRDMFHVLAHRCETRGLVGMYRGVAPSLARQLVCNAGMFLCFEQLKKMFWEPSIRA